MIHTQGVKKCVLIDIEALGTSGTATGCVDTRGFNYLSVDVQMGSAAAASNNLNLLHLSEGDTSTAFTTVAAFVGDTGFTIPGLTTAAPNSIVRMNMNLLGRKRWILCTASAFTQATNYISAMGTLGRADVMPDTTTEAGVTALVNG